MGLSAKAENELETWRPPSELGRGVGVDVPIRLSDRRFTDPSVSGDVVPRMIVGWEDELLHSLTREEIFLLSLVDGRTPLASLFDISATAPDVFTGAFRRLVLLGVLTLDKP